jgi:serpin B
MKKIIYFAMIMFLTLSISCQKENGDGPVIGELPDAEPIVVHLEKKVVTDNAFAFDIFKATYAKSEDPNVFISPLSISMAFNMVVNGAAGVTFDEIVETLHAKSYKINDINEHSRLLRSALTSVDASTNLSIANSIWYQEGFPVKNAFLDVNRTNYDAEVRALDFSSADAVKIINDWCAKNTNDKIKEIIKEIPFMTVMHLINAVYFKGIWTMKFDKNSTRQEDFRASDGKTNQVQMMQQTENFNYTQDEYAAYLELLYGNKAFGMVVMLPMEGKTTNDIVEYLDNDQWDRTIQNMYGKSVNLRLPRFKAECTYKLEKVFPDLGMVTPFSDLADFSGISDESLCISEVTHKTFVEVNEEGTEAAAVTDIAMEFTSSGNPTPQVIDFIVNKPFLFALYEKSSGVILFMGKIGEIKQ